MPPKRGRTKPAAGVARAAPAARPARGRRVKEEPPSEEPPSEESSSEESSSDDSDDDPLDFFHLMPSKDDKGEAISEGFRDWGKRTLGQEVDELVYGAADHGTRRQHLGNLASQ